MSPDSQKAQARRAAEARKKTTLQQREPLDWKRNPMREKAERLFFRFRRKFWPDTEVEGGHYC